MAEEDVDDVADAVLAGVGLLARRIRQLQVEGDLTLSEREALSRLSSQGAATAAELARAEQISPQSMGATLAALEGRGLLQRSRDPHDGRRVVFSLTQSGRRLHKNRRSERSHILSRALAEGFTATEIRRLMCAAKLLERLAHSIRAD